ncbi:hypothetical protein BST92_02290 [Nonlabens arenilitoris]|uniref:DUF1735 domain-containing protein n=1 Tax=Nonlabens arenilitoris TaxID=1217969 RepID=A0A2S7U8B4_9FLAO|nr:hypothetical protein [Nonlabens arenilitoris]PQJ30830.1 hypothetical protein BST92_02290 [Nonlabens arenilitoris]
MKKIKYISLALAFIAALSSCDETEPIIYNGGGDALITFSQSQYNLEIVIDDVGDLEVPVNASTLSSEDRTFNIEVVMDGTTALDGSYSVASSVTIPANQYQGTFTINGTDIAGVDTNPLDLVIGITDGDGYVTGSNSIVKVLQICPVDETFFTGDYQMLHLVFNGFGVPTFGSGKMVELERPAGNTRTFDAPYGPDLGTFSTVTWEFNLSCNEIVWSASQDALVGCAATAANIELSTADPAFGNGTYDPLNDATFTMNFVDDDVDDCGARTNVSILMTKI